jgi:CysZ protein
MLSDALESFIQIFSPPFRRVMWKSLRLTAIVLFLLGLGVDRLASSMLLAAPTWLSWILSVVVALGLIASLTFLAAPTASLVAGFYLDNIADVVEREIDPLYLGLRFAALSLLVNLAVLALTLFTGGVRRLLRPEWLSARAGIFRTGGHAPSAASTSR